MQDLYLSFPDEATAKAVLYRIEGAVEATETTEAVEGTEVQNFANIDTIGVIHKATGETTEQAIAGWHVNIRLVEGENAELLQAFEVTPSTPVRVWA